MRVRSTRLRVAIAAMCVGVLAVGCGSSPTDNAGAASGPAGDPGTGIEAVYAAVSGLTGTARYDKLLELAKKEGGTVGFYHSGTMTNENKAFTAQTGIKVADFQATSERVAERVSQENKAGRQGSDVLLLSAPDMVTLRDQGNVGKLDSPSLDSVTGIYKRPNLVSPIAIMMMPTYNTDAVKPGDRPASWTDYFTSFSKRKAVELTDWPWFYTIVTKYFMGQLHMTEQQATDLITNGMKGSSAVDGHTLVSQLLASGQYDYVPNLYAQYVPGLIKKGAPISYEGVTKDLPPTLTFLYIGLTAGSSHPAAGLLYLEWMMSAEGQKAVSDAGYVAPSNTYQGPPTLAQQFPYALIDDSADQTEAVQTKWKTAFDAVLKAAGTKKVTSK
jgi:iron(III) transport system substrate-binding protein